jgi:Proteasome assembly chaperone 4
MEGSLANEHAGIRTHDFSFKVVKDDIVDGSFMIMEKSCYIWLSCKDVPCNMGSLATAMPTRFSGIPISTILMNNESDISSEMAQRLAIRFKIQVFVSNNLPPSFEAYSHLIDQKVIEVLKEFF